MITQKHLQPEVSPCLHYSGMQRAAGKVTPPAPLPTPAGWCRLRPHSTRLAQRIRRHPPQKITTDSDVQLRGGPDGPLTPLSSQVI